MVKLLTREQEKLLLSYVLEINTEDAGCARMIFPLTDDLKKKLELDVDFDCIVKVPMGIGGYRQTQLEVKTYLEHHDYLPLADLAAYGHFVEIMERVQVEDWRNFYDDYGDMYGYLDSLERDDSETAEEFSQRIDREEDIVRRATTTMDMLNDFFGTTGDNGQIGINRFGDYVAYDYGYTTSTCTGDQVSDICDCVYDKDRRNKYIRGLVDLLDEEASILEDYEKQFLYDENGDGTYTRYKVLSLRLIPEDCRRWNDNKMFDKINSQFNKLEQAQEMIEECKTCEWSIKAYEVKKVVYNCDHDVLSTELIIRDIPGNYSDIWEEIKE